MASDADSFQNDQIQQRDEHHSHFTWHLDYRSNDDDSIDTDLGVQQTDTTAWKSPSLESCNLTNNGTSSSSVVESEKRCHLSQEKSSPQKAELNKRDARTPQSERDLRNRIGNRRSRQNGVGRSNYTRSPGGLSPLRSPRNHSRSYNVMEMDNSRSHRFTRSRWGSDHENRPRSKYSSDRSPSCRLDSSTSDDGSSTPANYKTVLSQSDDDEEMTPILSKPSPRRRNTWSRRRLQLPSENGESDNEGDDESRFMPTIVEEDPVRLARREKDILYGKNTEAYKSYETQVPREERSFDSRVHPRTPQKSRKCSRRSWDAQVKIWKRRLHVWAGKPLDVQPEGDITELSNPQVLPEAKNEEEDDDSFLDDLELVLSGAKLETNPFDTALN